MATLGECRFCRRVSAFHTHDECTSEYGTTIERNILNHYSKCPTQPLPANIQKELATDEWKFYVGWREYKEKLECHMSDIKTNIKNEAEKILAEKGTDLQAFLKPYNHITFLYSLRCDIDIRIEPRC